MNYSLSIPFRPKLQGIFRERFYDKAKLFGNEVAIDEVDALVEKEINWVVNECKINIEQRKVYRAAWLLIRDLLKTGWQYKLDNGVLFLILPNKNNSIDSRDELDRVKESMRVCMEQGRKEKILESAEFIKRMEKGNRKVKSITTLIADGLEFYNDLIAASNINDEESQVEALQRVIKPYLQLVIENERDKFTGLRLIDIWRYFRFTWANPAESTPGRTMLYLVRDAGRQNHPIVGIASLENSAIQITCRDNALGWTTTAFIQDYLNLSHEDKKNKIIELLGYINIGIEDVNNKGLCSSDECSEPDERVIMKLKGKISEATYMREDALKNDKDLERSVLDKRISKNAELALYMRKRANQLYLLLTAKKGLTDLLNNGSEETLDDFVKSETGQPMIRSALHAIKKRHIGSSVMELNVCGAIPPYNNILGGKLVALLMLSAEVVDNYRDRYSKQPSQIASLMKGESVTRPAELVYIGTTSLYYVGSSQYNRIKLPAGLFSANSPEVALRRLGETTGYGSMHISDETTKSLIEVSQAKRGFNQINNVFGEGASPKLRLIRMGVQDLMEEGSQSISSNAFSKHSMARIVYGARMITNFNDYIYGKNSKPVYFFNGVESKEVTRLIVDYWNRRWLLMRLKHKPALEAIKNFDKNGLLVSKSLEDSVDYVKHVVLEEAIAIQDNSEEVRTRKKIDYIRKLYKGICSYADYMPQDTLKFIHVETDLDSAIINTLENNKSVVLTGNPGDGKTHIFRILEQNIRELNQDIVVELDASILLDEEIIKRWRDAFNAGKLFCIAINEAVLFNLANEYPDFEPLSECKTQLVNAIYYDCEPNVPNEHVVVFDLSLRNTLSEDIISSIISKQTDSTVIDDCDGCVAAEHCDYILNAKLINTDIVRERLQYIFDRLNRRGYHFTLREVEGYISYLLFAGRTCSQLSSDSSNEKYYFQNLIYGADHEKARIFKKIKDTFDPVNVSHPIIDEKLVNGNFDVNSWVPSYSSESSMIDSDNFRKFKSRKRSFFFFNTHGSKLIDIADDDESEFDRFLNKNDREALRYIIRRLNLFFRYDDASDVLHAWQTHRYDNSPRRVLYSQAKYERSAFELVHPKLHSTMSQAFSPRVDHVLFRLKEKNSVSLKIDYKLFELLANAERGVPMMFIEGSVTRRIWQFIEKLDKQASVDEVTITIYDTKTREKCNVEIDKVDNQYIGVSEG